jgi:NDP-sugar pyrophosphorylase family protein
MSAPSASEPLPAVALLAGGLATRLRPISSTMPKSMVEVAGEPFIAHQLRLLVREGISDVVVCAGYLGTQIEDFVAEGRAFGCRVRYSYDADKQLGTGGALRRALQFLGKEFFVLYGDSYLDTRLRPIYNTFLRAGRPALMTVFHNAGQWDTSNVEYGDGVIRRYDKINRSPNMEYIDYGLGIIKAHAFLQYSEGATFDLSEVYEKLAARGQLAGHEVFERFYEIGSPAGLVETDAHLRELAGASRAR